MRADEYVVEELLVAQKTLSKLVDENRELRKLNDNLAKENEEFEKQLEKTARLGELLDQFKQYLVSSTKYGHKCIQLVYSDEQDDVKRIVTFDDEHPYNILIELLGPIVDEEVI